MIRELTPADFPAVLSLGEVVHGSGYMNIKELNDIYHKGTKTGINACFVV
ncbi:MAG: hypothetical protein ACJAUL_002813, partial [Paraglaciecola sp.]